MNRVLLLNASYEPLCTVVTSRAVALILQGKAQLIEQRRGAMLHSAMASMEYPSVIRLQRYVRLPYREAAPLSRNGVLRRDSYACIYCGREGKTIDHIVPRSRGGESSWLNLAACCHRCNNKKGNRLIHELGWELRYKPFAPGYWASAVSKLAGSKTDPSWNEYLMPEAA